MSQVLRRHSPVAEPFSAWSRLLSAPSTYPSQSFSPHIFSFLLSLNSHLSEKHFVQNLWLINFKTMLKGEWVEVATENALTAVALWQTQTKSCYSNSCASDLTGFTLSSPFAHILCSTQVNRGSALRSHRLTDAPPLSQHYTEW